MLTDLNLIRVFLAIWELRSLTDAAERLHLTQPAVSHALKRLRSQFDDPLFVRGASGMAPTEVASQLQGPFRTAMDIINRAVQDSTSFDPNQANRLFRIAMSDIAEYCYLPGLLERLKRDSPSVRIEVVRMDPATVETSLRTGDIDIALGYLPQIANCVSSMVLVDGFVGLIRAGHPFAGVHLDRENFAQLEYVYVSTGAPGHQMAERRLDELGIARKTGLKLAHITVTPEIIRLTDYAVIYPRSMAQRIGGSGAFRVLEIHLEMPRVEIKVHTHSHAQGDLGIRWLSRTLIEVCQAGVGSERSGGSYPAPAQGPAVA